MDRPLFVWKKTCDTCRRFKAQLDAWGVDYESREMNAAPMDEAYIRGLIGDRPAKPFLNPRNERYRALDLKSADPDAATVARLCAETNALLRRPLLVVDGEVVLGNDLPGAARLLGRPAP